MIGSVLARGIAAGAAGVTALNAVTYLDMAIRGRAASETPEQTVDALADTLGTHIPGRGEVKQHRRTALGALSGIGTGVAVGVAASAARAIGLRLPTPVGAVLTGAAAMAGSDVPMALLGISDPRSWAPSAWASDAIPHLAYGAVVRSVVHAQPTDAERSREQHPSEAASAGLLVRSALLGLAAGGRGSLGLAMPTLTGAPGRAKASGAALMVGGELVADKLPATPSRLMPPALGMRLISGAGGAGMLAYREQANPMWPGVVGAAGAAVGSWSGATWRSWAQSRLPDWQAALLEDAVSVLVAAAACLPNRGSQAGRPTYAELATAH